MRPPLDSDFAPAAYSLYSLALMARVVSIYDPSFPFNIRKERSEMMLDGKSVVVVGGSSGIGYATAELCKG